MRARRLVEWLALAAASLWLLSPGGPPAARPEPGLGRRLLGPIASLASSVEWVRFDLALRAGQYERAYLYAEHALALDPGAWQGWFTLASHWIYERGSPLVEPDAERRRTWVAAGLELLAHGETIAREPADLAVVRAGCLAILIAPNAEALAWPGGARAALEAAERALATERARGHSGTEPLLASIREDLAVLESGGRPPSWDE